MVSCSEEEKSEWTEVTHCEQGGDRMTVPGEREVSVGEEAKEEFEGMLGEDAAVVEVELQDGRMEEEEEGNNTIQARLSVEQMEEDSQLVMVRLSCNHYAFSLRRSTVTRTVSCFYGLQSILRSQNPWTSVPGLPFKANMWISSVRWRNQQLANFLAAVLSSKQFLSCRALHLFLQTGLSMARVVDNLEGRRDDQVVVDKDKVLSDTRTNSREGFMGVFGGDD